MFSNDQNVETIAQLIEVIKHYIGLQSEYVKLDVIDKVVRLLTMLVLIAVFGILLVIAIIYFSFAAAYALSDAIGSLPGYRRPHQHRAGPHPDLRLVRPAPDGGGRRRHCHGGSQEYA